MSMDAPIRDSSLNNPGFITLVQAMKSIQPQQEEVTAKSPQKTDKKRYVAWEKDSFKLLSKNDRKSGKLSALELAEKICGILTSSKFEKSDKEDLRNVIKGLDVLQSRVKSHQESQGYIKRVVFRLFGLDKTDAVLKQIETARVIAKKNFLKIEINNLETEISKLEKEIQKKQKERNDNQSSERRVLGHNDKSVQEKKKETKIHKPPEDTKEKKITRLKEKAARFREKTVGFFKETKNTEEVQVERVEEKTHSEEVQKKKTKRSSPIETGVLKKQGQLTILKNRLENKKQKFNRIVSSPKEKLAVLLPKPDAKERERRLENITSESRYLEGIFNSSNSTSLGEVIKSELGLDDPKKYEIFLRKLLFGFSVGQGMAIEELRKFVPDLSVTNLEDMLEGGSGVVNMFYLAIFLKEYISRSKGVGDEYIGKLKMIQSTIIKSLPFALRSYKYEMVSQSEGEVRSQLMRVLYEMKPGERLILPVGTQDHETLLYLVKTKKGYITTLYNTGDGVGEHMNQNLKGFYNAFFRGRFPTKKTFGEHSGNDENFRKTIIQLLSNRKENRSITHINNALTKNLGEGQTSDPKDIQINGTCSFQVFTTALEDLLGEHYDQFKLDLLKHIRAEFQAFTDDIALKIDNGREDKIALKLYQTMLKENQEEIGRVKKKLRETGKNS